MKLELASIETDTRSLDGLLYEPKGGATAGAVLIMHGNCKNFCTGREEAVSELVATWLDTTPAGTVEPAFASAHEGARVR